MSLLLCLPAGIGLPLRDVDYHNGNVDSHVQKRKSKTLSSRETFCGFLVRLRLIRENEYWPTESSKTGLLDVGTDTTGGQIKSSSHLFWLE